jgi:hypothetical protein
VILGQLDMRLKNGGPYFIMLASLRQREGGAFAAGEAFDRRVYFRGGDSTKLKEALGAAYKASQEGGEEQEK